MNASPLTETLSKLVLEVPLDVKLYTFKSSLSDIYDFHIHPYLHCLQSFNQIQSSNANR